MKVKISASQTFLRNVERLQKRCGKYNLYFYLFEYVGLQLEAGTTAPIANIKGYTILKIRTKDPCSSKGKSGGFRIIFAYRGKPMEFVYITVYKKDEKENILEHEIAKILDEPLQPYNPCDDVIATILEKLQD